MARDTRKLNGHISVPVVTDPHAKIVGTQLRTFGPEDDPDEVSEHLTAEEVELHKATDLGDGRLLLEGPWHGKLKERLPMPGSKKAKAAAEREAQMAAVHRAGGHKPKE